MEKEFLNFLQASPTPFHAVREMTQKLIKEGFEKLDLSLPWKIKNGKRYYLTAEDSTLIAFSLAEKPLTQGFKMMGAHTDSPCLKLRPNPIRKNANCLQTLVEVYGGVLLSTWFDRDLSLAGKIIGLNNAGKVQSVLVDFKRAVAHIPSLAIHLDRMANDQKSIQAEKEIIPLLSLLKNEMSSSLNQLEEELLSQSSLKQILSYDLSFYDTQCAALAGLEGEFITGARLDNLASCFALLEAFLKPVDAHTLLVCYNHEEVGSCSSVGAQSSLLENILKRLNPSIEDYCQMLANSFFVSADNAHGLHPNFVEKYQSAHAPLLGEGVALKLNSNQRYASSAETMSCFLALAQKEKLPLQTYMVRSDMPCGSTIGPMVSAKLGVQTVDLGIPSLAMHSIREIIAKQDLKNLVSLMECFLKS